MKTTKDSPYKLIVIFELSVLFGIFLAYFTARVPVFITKFLSLTPQFIDVQNVLREQQKNIELLELDRIRYEDMLNILLALQDFINEKGVIPEKLEELNSEGYLDPPHTFNDPESEIPYYYQSRKDNFIFCVYMSDRVKGVNVKECSPDSVKNKGSLNYLRDKFLSARISIPALQKNPPQRLIFSIIWTIWALLLIYFLYPLIRRASVLIVENTKET